MPDILKLISNADRLEFSQNFSIARSYLGDRLFPDQKTENIMAEYLVLSSGASVPVMATVHAFDTEAEIGSRPAFDKISVEKLLIKRKINQTERLRLYIENGVYRDDAIVRYVADDMARMAESVKTRTEVAKMELLSSGQMTINENNLSLNVKYNVPAENTAFSFDFSSPDNDILGQMQTVADAAADAGQVITGIVTSSKVMRKLMDNKAVQTAIYGSVGTGTLASRDRIQALFGQLYGFTDIEVYDAKYAVERADSTRERKRFYPENKISFLSTGVSGAMGVGLWGPPPEEAEYGQYSEKSAQQFITITQWATQDPVAVWTKASGLFIPVLPNPDGLFVATVKLEPDANP